MFGTITIRPTRYRSRPLTDIQKILFILIVLYGLFVGYYLTPGFAEIPESPWATAPVAKM